MGKLIKIVLLLAVIGGGAALFYNYVGVEEDAAEIQAKQGEGGVQVQEKYGFAPIGEGGISP